MAAQGARGLFQGHLATLLRIFPYAGVKFMAYDKLDGVSRQGYRWEKRNQMADIDFGSRC